MLTAIGRAAAQRLVIRAAPLTASRAVPRVACRAISTTKSAHLPAKAAAASSTKTKAKKTTTTAAKKKPVAKKPAAKKPAAKTKKVAAKKPAKTKTGQGRGRPRRAPTPEEKLKVLKKELKQVALLASEPSNKVTSAWMVYQTERLRAETIAREAFGDRITAFAEDFKNLSTHELQRLQETAEANKLKNNAAYKAWVESHTPLEINNANNARKRLRALSPKEDGKRQVKPRSIIDERLPNRPTSAFLFFVKARWAQGDLPSAIGLATKAIGEEWNNLTEAEKAPYLALAKSDMERYERDVSNVLGREVEHRTRT
ncbi:High mobility group-T protein [Colletotrichum sp. SAR 10_70]|nr:High mobility group-T protein [Colletotrichum sp. SAR 10_71]KAI8151824.1 High mobility group-T protein [Colletotrichum sp. SAR 10_70]